MPFINGRYHVNPIMGQALEAAREAEAALLALQQRRQPIHAIRLRNSSGTLSGDAPRFVRKRGRRRRTRRSRGSLECRGARRQGPIHRVEIEVTEITPPLRARRARLRRTRPSRCAVVSRCFFRRGTACRARRRCLASVKQFGAADGS